MCEGKNQSELKYFNHFVKRDNPYNFKIISCIATDPLNMAKKAKGIIIDNQLDFSLGDRIFCLVDVDLSQNQMNKIELAQKKYFNKRCKIEFILSNPCFEIWLLYHFTDYPNVENSSQHVKRQLKKYVKNYKENMDIIQEYNFNEQDLLRVLTKVDEKNQTYSKDVSIIHRNPYTEIGKLVRLLLTLKNNQNDEKKCLIHQS